MSEDKRRRRALSVSQVRNLHECPWAYRELTLRKYPAPRAPWLDLGTEAHDLIRAYIDHLLGERREQDIAALPTVFERWLGERIDTHDGIPTPRPPLDSEDQDELRGLLTRFATGFRLDTEQVWMPEAEMAFTWPPEERWAEAPPGEPCDWTDWDRVGLRMKCDLVLLLSRVMAHVWDWKSGWAMLTEKQMAADAQARTYAMGINMLNPDVKDVRVSFYYARWGVTRTADFGPESHARTWREWLATSEQIERMLDRQNDDRVWKPTPGPHCAQCGVLLRCPLRKVVPEIALTDDALALQAAQHKVVYDAAAGRLTEQLKSYVDARGGDPIPLSGGRLGYYKDTSWSYDVHQVRRIAREHGIEPEDLMRVDPELLRRAMRRNAGFAQALEAIRVDTGLVKFRLKKGDE